MKKCKKCEHEKADEEFYKNHDECKICWKEYCSKRNKTPEGRAKRREILADWRSRNKDKTKKYSEKSREKNAEKIASDRLKPESRKKMLQAVKRWREENKERYLAKQVEYKKKNRYKINARFRVTNAIRRGKMVRGTKCDSCGIQEGKMEAHHEDYSKPLEVKWMCFVCHRKQHNKLMDL